MRKRLVFVSLALLLLGAAASTYFLILKPRFLFSKDDSTPRPYDALSDDPSKNPGPDLSSLRSATGAGDIFSASSQAEVLLLRDRQPIGAYIMGNLPDKTKIVLTLNDNVDASTYVATINKGPCDQNGSTQYSLDFTGQTATLSLDLNLNTTIIDSDSDWTINLYEKSDPTTPIAKAPLRCSQPIFPAP